MKLAEAENRNARLLIERDDLDKELAASARKLHDKTAKRSVLDAALGAHRQRLVDLQKVGERKDAHLVRLKGRLVELGLVRAESDGTRNDEERAIKALHEQLDKLRRDCDELQRQWSRAEQHLIGVAMASDSQTVQEDKLREGERAFRVRFEWVTYFMTRSRDGGVAREEAATDRRARRPADIARPMPALGALVARVPPAARLAARRADEQ